MPAGPVTPRLLQRLCYDIVQRGPKLAELRTYPGAEVATIANRLLQSREAMSAWFEQQLQFFLLLDRFRPRGDSIDQIPRRLQKGRIDARTAIGEILLSTGFSLRNPGNDTFVTVLLEQCMGITVQDRKGKKVLEAGKKMYDGKKSRLLGQEGRNQSDLIQIVLKHEGFARHLLDRHHRQLLDAPLPEDAAEVGVVHRDFSQFFPTLGTWIASDAYQDVLDQRRTKSERQFLRGLYYDLLERPPDQQEMRNLRNAMQAMADPAPLRSVLAKVILDSSDARLPRLRSGNEAAFVEQCFLRYLARDPEQQERATFVAVLEDGGKAAHVVRALVGSLEYQTY